MDQHPRAPMPSRPSLPPPPPPKGAKPVKLMTISDSVTTKVKKKHLAKHLLIALVVILLLLSVLAALIAKTGVYTVPLFSSFYSARPVTRVVEAPSIMPRDLMMKINTQLRSATSTKGGDISITVSEAELTGALKGAFETALKRPGVVVDRSQIVVTPSGLEVAASVRNETMYVKVIAMIVPTLESGKVSFNTKDVYLGDLKVPASALSQIERIAFGSEIGSFEATAGVYGLKHFTLKDGAIDMVFSTSTKRSF